MLPAHRWPCPPPRAFQESNIARRPVREAGVSKHSLISLCLNAIKCSSTQQRGPSLPWFPLARKMGMLQRPLVHPQLHDPQLGILSLSSDPRQPVLVDWEPKSALQGCSIAEGENVGSVHKGGGVASPCLAGGCCLLPMSPACRQLIYGGLALTTGGKTQSDLHPC